MKKAVISLMIMTLCVLTGCSLPFVKEEAKEKPKEKTVKEQIVAPYIGYAPFGKETEKILRTLEQSFPEGSQLKVLKYEAGDNNKAIIRIEKLEKGKWKTAQEDSLMLTHNVMNGYLVFNGDKESGISLNTDSIRSDNKELQNMVKFKPEKYAVSKMFYRPKGSEGRMDLTEKKVLMLGFEKEPIHTLNGNIVPSTKGKPVDINRIYANKGGILEKVEQDLVAVTVEFTYDELIPKMPYLNKEGEEITYAAGLYKKAKVELQTLNPGEMNLDGDSNGGAKWETVGEAREFNLLPSGKVEVNGKAKDGELTVKVDGEKAKFEVPEDKDSKFEVEADGLEEKYQSAKKEVVLKMFELKDKDTPEAVEKDLKTMIIEEGKTVSEAYKDKETLADNDYITVYALVLKME